MNVATLSLDISLSALEILALRAGEAPSRSRACRQSTSLRPRLEDQLDILFCQGKIGMREYCRRHGTL